MLHSKLSITPHAKVKMLPVKASIFAFFQNKLHLGYVFLQPGESVFSSVTSFILFSF